MDNSTSLSALAKELGENKSRLRYYVDEGLLEPKAEVSNTFIFDHDEALQTLKKVLELRDKNVNISDIKAIIDAQKSNKRKKQVS